MFTRSLGSTLGVWMIILLATGAADSAAKARVDLEAFAARMAALGAERKIPGFSAAVVRDQKLVWSHGFGFADVEQGRRARPDTPYRLASPSKPLAAVVLMQLVEEGVLSLDDPMKKFAIHAWFEPGGGSWAHYPSRYQEQPITIRHVLTHTSKSDPPGEAYEYSGNLFADLTWVIEDATGQSYPHVLEERLFAKAGMKRSLAGQMVPWGQKVAPAIARPYKVEGGHATPSTYPRAASACSRPRPPPTVERFPMASVGSSRTTTG